MQIATYLQGHCEGTLYRLLLQKSEDILTPEGVMEVYLIEAENVPKMDFFGSGQPFGK